MTKVSVIVPVYNEAKYVGKCIRSLACQTLTDIEIILINDGSKDSSIKIMRKYEKIYDNIIAIDMEHKGVGAARNKGLDIAKGEYIKFVDADDYLEPNALEIMYNLAKQYNVDLVRCNFRTILGPFKLGDFHSCNDIKGNKIIDVYKDKDFIVTETPALGNKFIKKELLGNFRFEDKIKWEDLAIAPALLAKSKKIYYLDSALYNYRANLNTTAWDQIKVIPNIDDIFKVLKLLKENMPDGFEKQYESIYIIHTLFRIQEVIHWVFCSYNYKSNIIKKYVNILNNICNDWNENEMLEIVKRHNKRYARDIGKIKRYLK